jgi:predicted flap endonuclease-1-like 5' DNA nuclease
MSAFACCFWWFLAGLLLGWLLNWLLSKFMGKGDSSGSGSGGSSGNSYNTSSQASHAFAGAAAGAATALMTGSADVAKAAAAGFKLKNANDLEIIEGIGPKIAGLFNDNGITTFAQVSAMSVPAMNAILEKGGSRFKLANPSTWAEQARLCHENRWSELQALQNDLSAGVDKS